MNTLHIETQGVSCWRARLANPATQWERGYSALETAVSWETAAKSSSGLPKPIETLLLNFGYASPELLLAVAEHKVPLAGKGNDSQCDVWALIKTSIGTLSLSVEAKAKEPFGDGNKTLDVWLKEGADAKNRQLRWGNVKENLPQVDGDDYSQVPYQLLHRCATAVIEANRFGLQHAIFIVQAFESPDKNFLMYSRLCQAMGINAQRGQMSGVKVGNISLSVGWADCLPAEDKQLASIFET